MKPQRKDVGGRNSQQQSAFISTTYLVLTSYLLLLGNYCYLL